MIIHVLSLFEFLTGHDSATSTLSEIVTFPHKPFRPYGIAGIARTVHIHVCSSDPLDKWGITSCVELIE